MRPIHTLLSVLFAATFSALSAQYLPPDPSGLQGIIVERYYVADSADAADLDGSSGLMPGAVTYRVFADLKPGYKLLTVGGFADHPITFSTSTTFFNNDDRGEAWGGNIGSIHLDENTVALDSWLTIGAASDSHWGVLKTADPDGSLVGGVNNDGGSNAVPGGLLVNAPPSIGVPLTTSDGLWSPNPVPTTTSVGNPPAMFDAGTENTYSDDNFAWAVLGGIIGPDTSNRILIGQFTTDGEFQFCLNLWVRIPDSLVCSDPNCQEILEYYADLLPSDTAGTAYSTDNKFTMPGLCFDSSQQLTDCAGVPDGPAQPGTPCDDGNAETSNDVYASDCTCLGEDCLGVLGGNALPGQPCDDGDPNTVGDVWQTGCLCDGTVGINEISAASPTVSIRPNPAREMVWVEISIPHAQAAELELRDALGSVVLIRQLGTIRGEHVETLDLSRLNGGIYFLSVRVDGQEHIERITHF